MTLSKFPVPATLSVTESVQEASNASKEILGFNPILLARSSGFRVSGDQPRFFMQIKKELSS